MKKVLIVVLVLVVTAVVVLCEMLADTKSELAAEKAKTAEIVAALQAADAQTNADLTALGDKTASDVATLQTADTENAAKAAADLAAAAEKAAADVAAAADKAAADLAASEAQAAANLAAAADKAAADLAASEAQAAVNLAAAADKAAADVAALSAQTTADITALSDKTAADVAALQAADTQAADKAAADLGLLQATDTEAAGRVQELEDWVTEYELRNKIVVTAGSTVVFGSYEQDDDVANGREGIEWIVLRIEEGRALLMSRFVLDAVRFDTSMEATWETSYVRGWLNGTFMNAAFTPEQQSALIPVTNANDASTGYEGYPDAGWGQTTDKIWLLSYQEAIYYLRSAERKCMPTVYAASVGASTLNGCARWWLRSSGNITGNAADIYNNGFIHSDRMTYDKVGVRPVIWVDTTSEAFSN